MPGIVPLGRCEPISYHRVPYIHHKNAQKVASLRQPFYCKAYPSLKEHFSKAVQWERNNNFDYSMPLPT